ncbi:conserved hypothetical protein [Ricinus communis]|uniref:Uncharacterized protein n=1 Tax=Ricinus communis TaxID=3988 RepID=B9RU25_RICCO|nr:conserved hypothetical protein [Ricinus communis]
MGAPSLAKCLKFCRCMDDYQLQDLGLVGAKFTWHRGRVSEHLGQAILSLTWRMKFHEAIVRNLPQIKYDHCPFMLHLFGASILPVNRRPFHFEAAWLTHGSDLE